ncbi:CBF/Mak21 family-domain-containing protein [Lyophyllum atratum]|nr:CBF/Mak21 family-domain-containing protein [Lyophyllum atratum]
MDSNFVALVRLDPIKCRRHVPHSNFLHFDRRRCPVVHDLLDLPTTQGLCRHQREMARLRKEKGSSSQSASTSKPKPTSKKSNGMASDAVLREQVLALGGTQEDIDLVKGASLNAANGRANDDPALSKDVSAFLNGLNLSTSEPKDSGKKSGGINQKLAKKPTKARTQKDSGSTQPTKIQAPALAPSKSQKPDKKNKKPEVQAVVPPAPAEPDRPADVPKVQLPTKVTFDSKSPFVFQPIALWHTAAPRLAPTPTPLPSITPDQVASLTQKASELHYADIRTFQTSSSSNSSSSEANFLSKIIQSGTLSDRLSALTLLVQSSPIHNTKALETLKGMAERGKGKGGREESLKALRCVVDWWVGGGAPDRKLKYFRDQPLNHPSVTDEHLLIWYFEDWLKKYFFSILQILETLSLDPLQYVRTQSLTLIFTLLRDKPEQEQNLLRLLVNKLGDTEKSLCSRSSYHLLQLLQSHPSMKAVVVREIIALVLRPPAPPSAAALPASTGKHIRFTDAEPKKKAKPAEPAEKKTGNAHARYYSTITFNQIVLTPGDRDVSLKLIDVYFEMFKELLGEDPEKTDDVDGEGEGEDGAAAEVRTDKKGRVKVRDAKGKKGKGKGRVTEVKGAAGFAEVEDAHSRLISAILTGVNRALPFAKIDAGDIGLNKHIDTLFLITHTSTFNISLQALVLIQQIAGSLISSTSASSSSTSKSITDRYYRTLYDSLHDTRLASSSKQAMYLNLLFKSIKADAGNTDGERVKAIVRRFVQVLATGGGGATEFIAGGLYLLGEVSFFILTLSPRTHELTCGSKLFSTVPGLRAMVYDPPKTDAEPYDPRKRDPQYAHASSSPLWELTPLVHHYHPAISLHARQLLSSQPLTASADLSQNTLSHFLDRFVYKNPKKIKQGENAAMTMGKAKGASAMQPAASGLDGTGVKLLKGEVEDGALMNEESFLRKKVEDVPVDQVRLSDLYVRFACAQTNGCHLLKLFYHNYFSRKSERAKAKAAKIGKRKGQESDDESEGADAEEHEVQGAASGEDEARSQADDDEEEDSDEDEAEIWKAMKASMPKAIGDDEDIMEDSDDLPSDLDMDDDSGDEEQAESPDEDDDDALSLVEGSDNEDLISLDGDVPDGLIEWDGSDGSDDENAPEEEGEWGGLGEDAAGGKKRKREETSREKRKKLRSLPTFASYEDYAKMIEDGPEDHI